VRRWCPDCDEFTESAMVGCEEICGQCGAATGGDRWLGDHWASEDAEYVPDFDDDDDDDESPPI
jgi:hypothetical protein